MQTPGPNGKEIFLTKIFGQVIYTTGNENGIQVGGRIEYVRLFSIMRFLY